MNCTDEERTYCVYMHTSPSNKIYIGITKMNPKKRWSNGYGYKKQQLFWRAICKYGWENFKHEIIYSNLTKHEAEEKEIALIAYYKSNQRNYGYNVENGGNATGKIAETTKKKLSEITAQRMSDQNARDKIANSLRGNKLSEEHRKHISKSQKIPVFCIELNKVFDSARDAGQELQVDKSGINNCCRGKSKQQMCKGFHWLYLYDRIQKDGTVIFGAISLGYVTEEELKCAS